ncbi:Protection of telomeres 1 [Fusarium albosuccineum]|uniref:Protection of telomeres 1 n=1 Tax=Fusarium albosuccineum TaxID=1237068 RepID=A0A8H4L948_9HYPO|nr:Protection of telomeres 1 [Fusarium albosuccineum]
MVYDHDFDSSITLNIFRPQNDMPTAGCGDVILIRSVKVQKYQMEMPSLLTNFETKIAVYTAGKIPKPPADASCALRPPARAKDRRPDDKENAFISEMYHGIDKSRVPAEIEFETMVLASANTKDKFSLVENIRDGRFCDLVVEVIRPPYDAGDKITLWVTDYTENSALFHFSYNTAGIAEGRDGDPWGYTDKFAKPTATSDWPGPFGKRCMQVTCWDPHVTAIRETKISMGTWVSLRNLQIKLGRNGSNLEGFLRDDRGSAGPKINIWPHDLTEDAENIDPRVKEGLRRKRNYERTKRAQLKDITNAGKAGQKRKADVSAEPGTKKKNARTKRTAKRAQARLVQQTDQQPVPVEGLNSQVKCENGDKSASLMAELTEPVHYQTTIDGQDVKLQLPFVNANYRANVRIVNFSPPNLVDFAHLKKESQFDVLSDDGEESVSGSDTEDEQSEQTILENLTANRRWEWRFYLQLEDAVVPDNKKKQRVWVAVDNQAAQCLLSLDASNLRQNTTGLQELRDRLFTLWGELEEHKSREQMKKEEAQEAARMGKPPGDSGDEDEPRPEDKKSGKAQVAHRSFSCCIRQYGVKVQESDPAKADAGEGKRWQRMFGLFGTRISG